MAAAGIPFYKDSNNEWHVGSFTVPAGRAVRRIDQDDNIEIIIDGIGRIKGAYDDFENVNGDAYASLEAFISAGVGFFVNASGDGGFQEYLGVPNGIAELDSSGFVVASQLPWFTDKVEEYANLAAFPVTGEVGVIYIALDTNKTYLWGSTVYVEITGSLALGETSASAYRGDRGKIAYDHSLTSHLSGVTAASVSTTADADTVYNTTLATEPYLVTATDAEGWQVPIKLYLDTTWKVLIPALATTQTVKVRVITKS